MKKPFPLTKNIIRTAYSGRKIRAQRTALSAGNGRGASTFAAFTGSLAPFETVRPCRIPFPSSTGLGRTTEHNSSQLNQKQR